MSHVEGREYERMGERVEEGGEGRRDERGGGKRKGRKVVGCNGIE